MTRKNKVVKTDQGYNITVTGRHIEITEAMKDYAIDKVLKMERVVSNIIDVAVTIDIQKLEHKIDIVFRFDHFKVKAQAATNDMYASIDKAVDKLQSQLHKYKSRIKEHQSKGLSIVDMNVNVYRPPKEVEEIEDINEEIEEETRRQLERQYKAHEIDKQEKIPLKILTHDEAIMKMELSGDDFMVFRNEPNQTIEVIYRRKDNCYGIIETA
jgi:putative sigma-54 modulation protein